MDTTNKTQWYRLLGKEFELLLPKFGVSVSTELEVISNPPKADILLLRLEEAQWTEKQRQFLPSGIRDSQAAHILIEFKYRETITEDVIQQALGYDFFYRQSRELTHEQVATFIISSQTPQALEALGYRKADQAGVYQNQYPVLHRATLIVLNELSLTDNNAFVQCFASQKKVRSAAFQQLRDIKWQDLNLEFWNFLEGLQNYLKIKKEDRVILTEEDEEIVTPEMIMETGRLIRQNLIATLTTEERLALINTLPLEDRLTIVMSLPPEQRLAGLEPEQRLAGLEPEQRLAGLEPEQRLAGLEPEQRLAGLEPEQRLAGLEPEQRLAGLEPEQRLAGLEPEQWLEGLEPEQRLAGLEPEQRLIGLSPKERLVGLTTEELQMLFAQIELYLYQHQTKNEKMQSDSKQESATCADDGSTDPTNPS